MVKRVQVGMGTRATIQRIEGGGKKPRDARATKTGRTWEDASEVNEETDKSMPGKLMSRSAGVFTFATFALLVTTLVSAEAALIVARFDVKPSFAPDGLASPPVTFRNVASAVAMSVLLTATFGAAPPGVVRNPPFVALRGGAVVALKESNRESEARRLGRTACRFGVSTATLVVPFGCGGVGRQQPASLLLFLLTGEASETVPISTRDG